MKKNHKKLLAILCLCGVALLLAGSAVAQDAVFVGRTPGPGGPNGMEMTTFGPPPFAFGFQAGPGFEEPWSNPHIAEKLGLTPDQQKKLEDLSLQHQLKSIDLRAAVEREETILHSFMNADQPDESKITAQIDKAAQARGELEKEQARMMLGVRRVLSPEQWNKLRAARHEDRRIFIKRAPIDPGQEMGDDLPDAPIPNR